MLSEPASFIPQPCPKCETMMNPWPQGRAPLGFVKGGIEPQFNPAFGKIIHSNRQLNEELAIKRDQGVDLVEIGNERPEKLHDYSDRAREQRSKDRWAKADQELGLNR
jgi:hypothetical protein